MVKKLAVWGFTLKKYPNIHAMHIIYYLHFEFKHIHCALVFGRTLVFCIYPVSCTLV